VERRVYRDDRACPWGAVPCGLGHWRDWRIHALQRGACPRGNPSCRSFCQLRNLLSGLLGLSGANASWRDSGP
jgi:hypothetical protein